jgi:cell division protein FtsA
LRRSGFEDLIPAGLVLSGGSARIEGVTELAEEIFHMPVRVGVPQHVTGLHDVIKNPVYATGVGLLLFARQHSVAGERHFVAGDGLKSVWAKMRHWFQGNF